ncbi:hypothetical protein [Streptomyces sp. NPDC002491]
MPVGETRILYQQPLFLREELRRRWAERHMLATSATELESFYEQVVADPRSSELGASREVVQEALAFYNAVVADGRHIYDLRTDPQQVARTVGHEVSDEAAELVSRAAWITGEAQSNDVTIVLAIVIVIVAFDEPGEVVVDWSQRVEFKV